MEGRRHKRKQVQVGCWILGKDGVSNCCSSFDISDSGISICTDDPISVGNVVCLQLYTPRSAVPLSLSAEVIWSQIEPEGAMGLKFLDITQVELAMLREMAHQMMHRERHAGKLHGKL